MNNSSEFMTAEVVANLSFPTTFNSSHIPWPSVLQWGKDHNTWVTHMFFSFSPDSRLLLFSCLKRAITSSHVTIMLLSFINIELNFKAFRELWLRSDGWWWDELVEWRKWEETGEPRENPRTVFVQHKTRMERAGIKPMTLSTRGEPSTTELPRPKWTI